MKKTAKEICELIDGKLYGDPGIIVSSFSDIKNSKNGDITFLSDLRYKKFISTSKASIIITPYIDLKSERTIIKSKNPLKDFAKIVNIFQSKTITKSFMSKSSIIDETASIGKNVYIGANAVIKKNTVISDNCIINANCYIDENCKIGKSTTIDANSTIHRKTIIGNSCKIYSGVVIGSEGFGFIPTKDQPIKMPQLGRVVIMNNVEIGSNTTIDRGTFGDTKINDGVKLDNLIQIGHNVEIGSSTIIAAQTGIAGSTIIGKNCLIGGQVAISDHISIGNNVKIAGKSGVIKDIKDGEIVQGPLAFNIKDFQKSYIYFKKLPHLHKIISKLKK